MLHQFEQCGTVIEVGAGLESTVAERRQLDWLPLGDDAPREGTAHGICDHIAEGAALACGSFLGRGKEVRREIDGRPYTSKCSRHASR